MRKINSESLVCSAAQSQELLKLGIAPVACFCYEIPRDQTDGAEVYEFAGEFAGQDNAIPAFTSEELGLLIGGEVSKADLPSLKEWTENKNMLLYEVNFETAKKQYQSAARANADILIFLLTHKMVTPEQANERLEKWATGKYYNQIESEHFKNIKR